MEPHDPLFGQARTRLREALEHSAAGKFLRGARARWADAWVHARMPGKSEIRGLEQRGNECSDWSAVRLLGSGTLAGIRNTRFEGHCILHLGNRPGEGPSLRHSLIRNCLIGICTIESVGLLDRVIIDDDATLRHVGECTGRPESRFCLGLAVHPGTETGARRIFLSDGLLLADCTAMSLLPPDEQEALAHEWSARLKPCVSDYAFVGAHACIEHTRFVEDCFIGAAATVRGAAALRRCIVAAGDTGTGEAPVVIGDNVIAEDCVFESGVHLASAAQARRALFLEQSGAEQGGFVTDAVIGPNTIVAKGEITASLVGPFVGFHHQALLIGALWPEGRGNVGYGANVGSNHTGRKPDQELKPGEGTFFGLGCAIKFPADFSEAPYSLFATGVVTPPQKISLPFSLIMSGKPDAAEDNEIIPGWMWSENAYALIRNAYKYGDRNRARNHSLPALAPPSGSPLTGTFLASDLFATHVSAKVVQALSLLNDISSGKNGVLTGHEIPAIGKNILRVHRIEPARAAYRNFLAFAFMRAVLWEPEPPLKLQVEALGLAAQSGLDAHNVETVESCLRVLMELGTSVERSLQRDTDRGTVIFPDYESFHPTAGQDAVCLRLQTDLTQLKAALKERLTTTA